MLRTPHARTNSYTHARARACMGIYLFPDLQPVRHRRRNRHHTTTLSEGWALENHRKRRRLRVRGMGCCSHLTRSRPPRTRTSACFSREAAKQYFSGLGQRKREGEGEIEKRESGAAAGPVSRAMPCHFVLTFVGGACGALRRGDPAGFRCDGMCCAWLETKQDETISDLVFDGRRS
jgi:hypothetical protein